VSHNSLIKYSALILLLTIAIISCSSKESDKNYQLLYWCSNNTHEIEFAKYVVTNWNDLNPNSKVKFQPVPEGRSSEEVILAAVVGGTTPDIYSNMWQGDVEAYAQAGVLVALDKLAGFDEYINNRCDVEVIEEITSNDGQIYQIPWKVNPIMLIYNKNFIADLGYTNPPKTYSDYIKAAKEFQIDEDEDGYVDRWFGYSEVKVDWWQRFFDFYPLYLAASGGAPLIKNEQAAFNNDYAVNVFSFLRELYNKKYFPQERLTARQDPFLSGTIATRFVGPWEISHAEKFKSEDFEYDFTTMPSPDNHEGFNYTYGDPKNIVIFNTCKDIDLAYQFVKFSTNLQNDFKLLQMTTQYPRRKDLLTDSVFVEYFSDKPMLKKFAMQAKYLRGTDACSVLKEVFDLISQEYEACVIYGVKPPKDAVQDASDAVNLLFLK